MAGALAATLAVVAALLALFGWTMPLSQAAAVRPSRHPDKESLEDVGWRWGVLRWEACRVGTSAIGLALGLATGVGPLAAVFGAVLPSLVLRDRARSARAQARRAVARILITAHAAILSGTALPEALRQGSAAVNHQLARRPLDGALALFTLGGGLDDALRSVAARERDDRTRLALDTLALGIGERLSIERLAALVGALVERLAYEERLDDEVLARAGGARMQVRILAFVVPSLAGYLALTTPGVGEVLSSPLGRTVLVPAAAALELGGVLLSRRAVALLDR